MKALHSFLAINIIIACLSPLQANNLEIIYNNHLPEIDGESILSVFRDSRGFLWVGTYKGLIRYDGTTRNTYTTDESKKNTIGSLVIHTIFEDSKKRLWIGTNNGLSEYNYITNSFNRYFWSDSPQLFNEIRDITEDDSGNLYMVTYNNQGILKLDTKNKTNTVINLANVSDQRLNTIEFYNNKIWIGAELNGLFCIDLETNETRNLIKYDEKGEIITVNDLKIFNNTVWMGTWYNGLVKYDILKDSTTWLNGHKSKIKIPVSNTVRQITVDYENNLWLAVFGGGITKYEPNKNRFINIKSKLNNKASEILYSWAIHIDNQNIIWLGLFNQGLKSLYMKTIESSLLTFKNNNGETNTINYINKAISDGNGNIWIGTQTQGLIKYNLLSQYGQQIQLNGANSVYAISMDKLNRIWVSTNQGIFILDRISNKIFVNLANTNSFFKTDIKSPYLIYCDLDGDIWLTAWQSGLIRIPHNEVTKNLLDLNFEIYRADTVTNNGIYNNTLINVFQTEDKNLLVSGTYFIQKFNKQTKQFELFEWIDGESITEDCRKQLWIFSNSKGIIKYNREKADYKVLGIEGNLYSNIAGLFKSNCAVYFIRNNNLIKYNSNSNTFDYLGVNTGIKNVHHNNSCFNLNDSLIFMGGEEGCYLLKSKNKPISLGEIRLSKLFIYNKEVNANDTINNRVIIKQDISNLPKVIIPPEVQSFSIELSSINFNNPKDIVYAYKMLGFDSTWHYLEHPNRTAVFNNLNGGDYEFKFAIHNPINKWENTAKNLYIKIITPYYKTLWFKVLISVFIISLVILYFIIRQHRLKKLNKELEIEVDKRTGQLKLSNLQLQEMIIAKDKFFSIIGHDLRGPIGSLKGLLNQLEQNFDQYNTEKKLHKIKLGADSSNNLLNLVENLLLWSQSISEKIEFNPQNTKIKSIINENIKLTELNAKNKNIKIDFISSEENIDAKIDIDMFRFIIRNLLLNAIKFTHIGGNIEVILSKTQKRIIIAVVDNGVGIKSENIDNLFKIDKQITTKGTQNESGTGLGLVLCKDFVDKHKGNIWVESEINVGTTIYISLPNP